MANNVTDLSAARAAAEAQRLATLKGGGGGSTFDPMEDRVRKLEEEAKDAKSDLKAIRIDLAEIKGRLSGMPTTWQMLGFIIAVAIAMFTVIRIALPLT
ncbi:MAG: hypothetical protein ACO1OG_09595 [Devosia sp.]